MVWKEWWCGKNGGVERMVVWKEWWCGKNGGVEEGSSEDVCEGEE
jgi:hypothetical protein